MKTFNKSLVASAIFALASTASAGQVYLDVGTDFVGDTTTPTKVCPTCTSLKDQLTIKYQSSTDFFDTDGSLDLSIGDKIETDGGLDVGTLPFNNVTSLNPNQIGPFGFADNGYNNNWLLSFGFTDLKGEIVGFDGAVPLLGYSSGIIDLYVSFDFGITNINFMDLAVDSSANSGANISLFGTADFTNVDASFNDLFHYESGVACAGGSDSFFDVWSSATCSSKDLAIDFVLDQNTDPAKVVVNPAGPYPKIANITTDHDGSIVFNVPEPSSLALMGLSLLMIGGVIKRKKNV